MKRAFAKLFTFFISFKVKIPVDYDHGTQLVRFSSMFKAIRNFLDFDPICHPDLTDEHFAKVTDRLAPGKTYWVKIYMIDAAARPEDCLAFLSEKKALLVGTQGLSMVWLLGKGMFPAESRVISFDKRESLRNDLLPAFGNWKFRWYFDLNKFPAFLSDGNTNCLLVVNVI